MGDFKKAENYYKEALKIDPEFENAIYNLGVLYHEEGKKKLAEEEFKRLWEVIKRDGVTPEKLIILKKIERLGYIKVSLSR